MSTKISDLTDATEALATDEIPVARSSANVKITPLDLKNLFAKDGLSSGPPALNIHSAIKGGPTDIGVNASQQAVVANRIYFSRLIPAADRTITELGIFTNASVAGNFTLGIYNNIASGVGPGTLAGSVTLAVPGATAWTAGAVSVPVKAGNSYWLAYLANAAILTSCAAATPSNSGTLGYLNTAVSNNGIWSFYSDIGTSTMPADASGLTYSILGVFCPVVLWDA